MRLTILFFRLSDMEMVILIVYVDDIIIIGDDSMGIKELKAFFRTQFHTKDLEKLWYFLVIEVVRSKERISSSQRKYALDILDETGLTGSKLMDRNVKLCVDQGELMTNPNSY